MLAIGIISLLSLGLVGLISDDGGDSETGTDDVSQQPTDDEGGIPPTYILPPPHVDTPDDSHDDAESDGETAEESDAENSGEEQDTDRPPFGDDYRDPQVIADALEAQRLIDEIAAAEAREPTNLVTVTGVFDSTVSDELVLSEAPATSDTSDPEFIVTAPDAPNDIDVGYDEEHTFQIDYNALTNSVSAGLNSHIQGPEGADVQTVTQETDDDGVAFTQTTLTKVFESNTDITINVAQDQVGEQITQIDLSNAGDSLHFEFAGDVTSNFHLVFHEVEQDDAGDTNAIRSAYILETDSAVDELTAEHILDAISQGTESTGVGTIIAEIYLGEDALEVSGDAATGEDYAMHITDFVNQDPLITANLEWTSVAELEQIVTATPNSGSGGSNQGGLLSGLGNFGNLF